MIYVSTFFIWSFCVCIDYHHVSDRRRNLYVFLVFVADDYRLHWTSPCNGRNYLCSTQDFRMIIREVSASNSSFTHILINGKNVGTRNHVIAVIYENLGTPEEILHVKETYAGGGYIVAVKQDTGNI